MDKGLCHIYFGNGKGKTTAALGLGLRASGRGKRVLLVRFLKGKDSGELTSILQLPNFDILDGPEHINFTFLMDDAERQETREICSALLSSAADVAASGGYDLLILDEVLSAVSAGMLMEEPLISLVKGRPQGLEVVLSGNPAPPEIIALADYVSEIKKIKHPFDNGEKARIGIEY